MSYHCVVRPDWFYLIDLKFCLTVEVFMPHILAHRKYYEIWSPMWRTIHFCSLHIYHQKCACHKSHACSPQCIASPRIVKWPNQVVTHEYAWMLLRDRPTAPPIWNMIWSRPLNEQPPPKVRHAKCFSAAWAFAGNDLISIMTIWEQFPITIARFKLLN